MTKVHITPAEKGEEEGTNSGGEEPRTGTKTGLGVQGFVGDSEKGEEGFGLSLKAFEGRRHGVEGKRKDIVFAHGNQGKI